MHFCEHGCGRRTCCEQKKPIQINFTIAMRVPGLNKVGYKVLNFLFTIMSSVLLHIIVKSFNSFLISNISTNKHDSKTCGGPRCIQALS